MPEAEPLPKMARKRRGPKAHANINQAQDKAVNGVQQHGPDPSVACLALHPQGDFVAVAGGHAVRISNLKYATHNLHA